MMNRLMDGIDVARFTTASCPANADAKAARSNSDTITGVAPCSASAAALSRERASAVTAWPSRINAETACPPIAPVPPVTNTFMSHGYPTLTHQHQLPRQPADTL